MRTRVLLLLLAILVFTGMRPAYAQQEEYRSVRREARDRVSATGRNPRTIAVPDGRFDAESGVRRAAYRIRSRSGVTDADPERAARRYLASVAMEYGWAVDLHQLERESVERSASAAHVTFRQVYRGVPVLDGRVRLSLDRQRRPTMLLSAFAPDINLPDVTPAVEPDRAIAIGSNSFTARTAVITAPTLVIVPRPDRLAWRLVLGVEGDTPEEWQVLVEARTGDLVELRELGMHRSDPPARTAAVGAGLIYDPDPLTLTGAAYGGLYSDNGDATNAALDDARRPAALNDLTAGGDGLYRLEGPYARVLATVGVIGEISYIPPVEADPNSFRYSRNDPRFEAVMAYHHVDRSQRYVQALGFPVRQKSPVRINPRGTTSDNSQYFEEQNALIFGTGGIDDAEDATVIWHEYGHALLEAAAPGLRRTEEGMALHEGWSDYWAGSYQRDLVEAGKVSATDWRRIFRWDGNTGSWQGRRLDHPGHWPDDIAYPGVPTLYAKGTLWATTLMEIYSDLGRAVADRLNLASHGYLSHPVTFSDAAEAIIQADRDLYGGQHVDALEQRLVARGFLVRTWEQAYLDVARTSGGWRLESGHWAGTGLPGTSSIVLQPVDLPENADAVQLEVLHEYSLPGMTGEIRGSVDGGRTWNALQGTGTTTFTGSSGDLQELRLSLTGLGAGQLWIRFDILNPEGIEPVSFWDVYEVKLFAGTMEDKLLTPRAWKLHPNFPDPFSDNTTITYTVAEAGRVTVEVFDMLGRRTDTLVDEEKIPGTYSLTYSGAHLHSGIYMVRMISPGGRHIERIVVAR